MLSYHSSNIEFFHQLFEQRVIEQKERNAISFLREDKNEILSYSVLNTKVNQLAHHLLRWKEKKSLHSDKILIGLFFSNSPSYVISMLAVMKAGLSFVALSAKADRARLSLYLQDLSLNLVIVDNSFENDLFVLDKFKDISWTYNESDLIGLPSSNPNVPMSLKQLAYIHNTSGSSEGKITKKVLISHAGILNCSKGLYETLHITSEDQVAAFSDLNFDAHIGDIITALGAGACLHIVPSEHREIKKLEDFIINEKITVVTLTPRIIDAMNQYGTSRWLKQLRVLLCTGEPVTKKTVDHCLQENDKLWFVNGYGPAEVTIATTLGIFKFNDPELKTDGPLSIGKPFGDLRLHILEENPNNANPLKKVAPNTEGELCISGSGLALGYMDAELTKQRFVNGVDPDDASKSIRLYRTRDLAKQDNAMRFFVTGARIDRQIKNSAEVISPEEIETSLEQNGALAARVKLISDADGNHSFAATLQIDNHFDLYEFYFKVRAKLPAATSIKEWHLFKEPIVNSNGKTAFIESKTPQHAHSHAPKKLLSEKAQIISQIWHDLLNLDNSIEFTVDDNFFLLGGTSIHAQGMVALLRDKFDIDLSITDFQMCPTIGFLERMILRHEAKKEIISPRLLNENKLKNAESENTPLFLIHSITGTAQDDYRELIREQFTDRKVFGINARSFSNDENGMDISLYAIAEDYVRSVKLQQKQGPYLLAGWSSGGLIAYVMTQILQSRGETVFLHMIDSDSISLFQQMTREEYAHSLVMEFFKQLLPRFSIKQFDEATFNNLRMMPKTKQVYALIAQVEKLLPNNSLQLINKKILHTIKSILLGVLHYIPTHRVQNAMLWVAEESKARLKQKNISNNETLGWSKELVEFSAIHLMSGVNHHQIITGINSKLFKEFEAACQTQTLKESKPSLKTEPKKLTPTKMKIIREEKKWALPVVLPYYIDRPQLESSISTFLEESEEKSGKGICVITADGGYGKSSLANFIIENSEKGIKVWFDNADTESDLVLQYRNLAEYLGLISEEKNNTKSVSDTILIQSIKDYFEARQDWIIVYDNAVSLQFLANFLPKIGGQILITSRSSDWPKECNPILIDDMDVEHWKGLIKKSLVSPEKDFRINDLITNYLKKIPFAIAQACAYIKSTRISISDYMEEYNNIPVPDGINLSAPIWKTWQMNVKHIETKSAAAIILLQLCSLLDPVGIPLSFVKKILEERGINHQQFEDAKKLSINHYLIRLDPKETKFSIHRLIQEVTRYQFIPEVRSNLLRGLARVFITELDRSEDQVLLKQRDLVGHFIRLLDDVLEFGKSDIIFAHALEFGSRILSRLNGKMNLNKAITYLNKSIEMYKPHGNPEIIIKGLILKANLLWEIQGKENLDTAESIFNEALALAEKYNKSNLIADILHGLGALIYAFRKPSEAIIYFKKALALKNELFGSKDIKVAKTLYSLGAAYWDLGGTENINLCIDYSNQALAINEAVPHEERDNQITIINCNLGVAYHDLGGEENLKKAIDFLSKSYEAKNMIRNHPGMGLCAFYLGISQLEMKDAEHGIINISEGINILQNQVTSEHRFVKYIIKYTEELEKSLATYTTEKAGKLRADIMIFNKWATNGAKQEAPSVRKDSFFKPAQKKEAPKTEDNKTYSY